MKIKFKVNFQFSLWDSEKKVGGGGKREMNFQFSLWDSYYIKQRYHPTSSFQFSLWDSVLFALLLKVFLDQTFNSLYEILEDDLIVYSASVDFQFSLWDSKNRRYWFILAKVLAFNSLYEIPILLLENHTFVLFSLSILFMRFKKQITLAHTSA